MLDSGAFTILQDNHKKDLNLNAYIDAYVNYINKHRVSKYFELDIDQKIGYRKVLTIRKYLYQKTGVPPIPVWHKSRGMEDYKVMCKNYKYVAIGGYVSGEFSKKELDAFPKLIRYAHKCGAKIHGLGFTPIKRLSVCHFDSVDSTAWLSGNRYGVVYRFNGHGLDRIIKQKGQRVKNIECCQNNFIEWVKFQNWANLHL